MDGCGKEKALSLFPFWKREELTDYDADEGVDEEFLEEEESLICLVRVWKHAKDACGSAVENSRSLLCDACGLERRDLGPIRAHEHQAGHERTKDLREDVVRNFPPWETLPDGEADGNRRVEVASRDGCAGNDGKGDTDGKGETDLEDVAVERDGQGAGRVHGERSDGSDAGEDVEEDAGCFGHAFTETCTLSVDG